MAFVSITAYLVLCGSAAARLLITERKLLLVVYTTVSVGGFAGSSTPTFLLTSTCTVHNKNVRYMWILGAE